MPVIISKAPHRAAAIFAVSMAMLFTAACGSDEASTDSGTTGGTGQNGGNNAFAAYVSCLNENGVTVTMPSGGPGGDGSGGARPSGAPGGVRPSGAADGVRPSGQPRPSGVAGQRGGGFPGGGGFSKPEGVDDATWQKAQEACASVRPSMGAGRGNGNGGPGGNAGGANAAYLNCLKENGVTDTANLDTSDAAVKKATETCAVLKPSAAS